MEELKKDTEQLTNIVVSPAISQTTLNKGF